MKHWWSDGRLPSDDVGRQLGLIGPGAWAMFGLYSAVYIFIAFAFGQPMTTTPIGVVAVAGVIIGAALIASPSPTPLPLWRTFLVLALAIAAVLAITLQQPFHDRSPGWGSWEMGAANFLLFGLTLRQRVVFAWVGALLVLTIVGLWSVVVTGSPGYGLEVSYQQTVCLLAGTIFSVALHRTARRISQFRKAERDRASAGARESAASQARDRELQHVRALAEPTLHQIAAGGSPDPLEVEALEAALRDLLRGRALAIEPLTDGLRRARLRGADIVLLDDSGDTLVASEGLAEAARWCAAQLEEIEAGAVTIRLAASDGKALVTIVDDNGERRMPVPTVGDDT